MIMTASVLSPSGAPKRPYGSFTKPPPTVIDTADYADYYGTISVKDPRWGAKGDGVTDDTRAIQACFDTAFGSAASPHGNGGGIKNKGVYFPPGTYKITAPVRVTAVWGGKICGGGPLSSIITYLGPITPVNAEGFCPTLWLNGCNFCNIEGLGLVNQSDTTNHSTVCLWFGPDGASGGSSAHSNTLTDVHTEGGSYGVIHGSTSSAANSENTYIDCTFGPHERIGMFLSGANTLNIRMYGGAIGFCGVAGIKTNNSASMPIISNIALDSNYLDFDFSSGANVQLDRIRTESGNFIKTRTAINVDACSQACVGDTFTGSVANATYVVTGSIASTILTVTAITSGTIVPGTKISGTGVTANTRILLQLTGTVGGVGTYSVDLTTTASSTTITGNYSILTSTAMGSQGNVIRPGMAIYGTDATNSLPQTPKPTRVLSQLTGTSHGVGTYNLSDAGSPSSLSSSSLIIRPVFCDIVGSGQVSMLGCGSAFDPVIASDNNSVLWITSNQFFNQGTSAISADLLKFFTGQILAYDVSVLNSFTVANLPAAGSKFKGVRMFVTNSSVAASSSTFGATVAPGGANTVPVFCDGTNWVIG